MQHAMILWGYEISANDAVISIVTYLAISVLAIVFIPKLSVRNPDDEFETKVKVFDLRQKVRQSIIQVIGGATLVAAFIVTLQQIRTSEDTFREKKSEMFVRALSLLLDDASPLSKRAEAMHLLSYVARSEPSYHRTVFDAISNHVVSLSATACKNVYETQPAFQRNLQIQMGMRYLGERNPDHDPTGKRFNVEHTCLAEIDLKDEGGVIKGLRKARLSNAVMIRSDFTRADLSGAELQGIEASDYRNPAWTSTIGYELHRGEEGDIRGAVNYANGYVRRQVVTHFINADLSDANFQGAHLAGSDFSGAVLLKTNFLDANISRANFNGAQKLTTEQLRVACIGNAGMSKDELARQQPYLWQELRKSIGPEGIRVCP